MRSAPHPLLLDNPFLMTPYRTADGRWVMATAVYPHLAARWCRFLDVPPDTGRVAASDRHLGCASNSRRRRTPSDLPICIVRTPDEWLAHEQGALLASQPVIGLERIGDAPVRDFGPSERPFDGIRVLSFTHAVAGPTVGRTFAEHGADVLGATRPNDYEHEHIYAEANVGSRSAYIDLDSPIGKERAAMLLAEADVVVNNHRLGSLERRGLDPRQLAERHPGLVYVSVTCYGAERPVGRMGGIRHERISCLRSHDHRGERGRAPVSRHRSSSTTTSPATWVPSVPWPRLVKRATEGGSWHVTVSLTRTAMWCGSLGLVDPALAGCDEDHSLREPAPYDAPSPLGDVHMLAPPVRFSQTPPAWPDPILVPRGSSRPEWHT